MLAVTAPAVLLAGIEKAIDLVGASSDLAFLSATAVFATEALAVRRGGAARHGARLPLLPTAVFEAMLEPMSCWGGASTSLAPPIRTMPNATATGTSNRLATINIANFSASTAMPATQSS